MAEIGERHDGAPTDAQHLLQHAPGLAGRLQGLRENDIVEGVVGIIGEIRIGVALNHEEALRHAIIHAALRQFDAARVHIARLAQQAQQFAIAAAHIQHPRAALHHLRNQQEIDARCGHGRPLLIEDRGHQRAAPMRPRARAAESRKPRVAASKSGSSSRKASWPLSVSTSTKETAAPPAFSA